MTLTVIIVALIGAFVAYTNGANDVSKGIATLAGSRVSNYHRAILWGALWTACGSIAAFAFSHALVITFGKGLLAAGVTPTLSANLAILIGAGLWVGLATHLGLPVSTTHAIVGSIAGVMSLAYGAAGLNWRILTEKIALPLLLSPIASLVLTSSALKLWQRSNSAVADCLCVEVGSQLHGLAAIAADVIATVPLPVIGVTACHTDTGATQSSRALSLTFDRLHWVTSAAASFARGLNDAPKMVALVIAAAALAASPSQISSFAYLLIAFGVLAGSLHGGRRVTTVLAERITPMDHRDGFIANLVTAILVGPGAVAGLPMSMTHVASGAIIGIGIQKDGAVDWQRVREMSLAWIVTLPAAAVLGILSYGLLRAFRIG
jgi:PiT family inorganic phosphate transporter